MSKAEILDMPTIAYWSGLDGLEIKDIEHGINDYVRCVSGTWYGGKSNERAHRVKIRYNKNGDPYIVIRGYRIPLSECIACRV